MRISNTLEFAQLRAATTDKIIVMPFCQEDVALHDHAFFELAYVTSGTAIHTIESSSETVRQGDYFIIDYGIRHSYQQCKNFTLINCLFLPEMIEETMPDCRNFEELLRVSLMRYCKCFHTSAGNRIFHDHEQAILPLLRRMEQEYHDKKTAYAEVCRCCLKEILILTMRNIIHSDVTYSTTIGNAIQYLNRHYKEKAVLEQFCHNYHYSKPYISRKFKEETNLTALEYLQKIRIEKSCELLAVGELQIHEVANAVGYEDIKFFHTLFKRMLKMTPGTYQKLAGNKS